MLVDLAERRRDPILMLTLSVYFLLLAFFVVLSRYGEADAARGAAVAEGLRAVFGGISPLVGPQPAPHDPELADLLQAALDAALPVARGNIVRSANAVELHIDADSLFAPGSARAAGAFAPLVDRIVGAMRAVGPGTPLSVDVVAGDQDSLAAARAAALARALAAVGVAEIAAGVESGAPGALRLVFSLHGPAAP